MNTRIIPAIAISALTLGAAMTTQAAEVDSTAVTTFTAGSAAKASEVNGNFTAVIDAVNDNAASIADLQDSIATLQAALEDVPTAVTEMSDLVGRQYCLVSNFAGGAYEGDNFARVNMGSEFSILSVTSETQIDISAGAADELELGLMLENYDYTDNGETYSTAGLQGSLTTYSEAEGGTATVTSLSDGVMTVDFGGVEIKFYVSKYGDVILARDFDDSDSAEMWSSTIVAVECK